MKRLIRRAVISLVPDILRFALNAYAGEIIKIATRHGIRQETVEDVIEDIKRML